MRGPGSIPTGGNILSLEFFHKVKPLMSILPLLPILSICEKPDWAHFLETDSRKAWMVVVSSHQHLPAWNRTEQNLKFLL